MEKSKLALLQIHALREINKDHRLLILNREINHYNATTGTLICGGYTFNTIELPWKENQINISQIPSGTYTYQKITRSSNNEPATWIRNVENRSEILIHQGTKPIHSKGCILLPNYNKFHHIVNSKGLLTIINE